MKRPAVSVLFLFLASACAGRPVESGSAASEASPASASSDAEAKPGPIDLGRLPQQGLVVSSKRISEFLDLEGNVLAVAQVRLALNGREPGVWFQRRKSFYRLDLDRGWLAPVQKERVTARARSYNEALTEPKLPLPEGTLVFRGDPAGHWSYALRSPSGHVLAQWSGECEVPTAYWIEPGSTPRVVTGEASSGEAPESEALGWRPDGRALVYLGVGTCGGSGDPPGIYAFSAPGVGELIYRTHGLVSVEMWHR